MQIRLSFFFFFFFWKLRIYIKDYKKTYEINFYIHIHIYLYTNYIFINKSIYILYVTIDYYKVNICIDFLNKFKQTS